jgi:hypothetical protein
MKGKEVNEIWGDGRWDETRDSKISQIMVGRLDLF